MPSVFAMGHIDLMKRFLNAMNVTYVPMIASIITSVMHLGFLFIFVTCMQLEVLGLVISSSLTFSLQLAIVMVYASWFLPDLQEAIQMPTKDVFSEWRSYFSLAIPSMMMLCAEWWAFEIITIMSGYLGVDE